MRKLFAKIHNNNCWIIGPSKPKDGEHWLPVIEARNNAPWYGVPVKMRNLVNEYGSAFGVEFQQVPVKEAEFIAVSSYRMHGKRCECDMCLGISSVWSQERWTFPKKSTKKEENK